MRLANDVRPWLIVAARTPPCLRLHIRLEEHDDGVDRESEGEAFEGELAAEVTRLAEDVRYAQVAHFAVAVFEDGDAFA